MNESDICDQQSTAFMHFYNFQKKKKMQMAMLSFFTDNTQDRNSYKRTNVRVVTK